MRCLRFGGHQSKPVQFKKSRAGQETRTLVAINKRMVFDNAGHVSRCQFRQPRFAIFVQISQPGQCRLKQAVVAEACTPAMIGQGNFVGDQNCGFELPWGGTDPDNAA